MRNNNEQRIAEDEIDLRSFFYNLRKKWYYFLLTLIVVALASFLYIHFTLPRYEAKTSILVKDSKNNSSGNIEDILTGDLFGNSKNIATEIGILQSRSVLSQTIDELNLKVGYFRKDGFREIPVYKTTPFTVSVINVTDGIYDEEFKIKPIDSLQFSISINADNKFLNDYSWSEKKQYGEEVRTPYFTIKVEKNLSGYPFSNDEYIFRVLSENHLIKNLSDEIKVESLNKDATIVNITYTDVIPERANDFLATLGNVYINRDIEDKTSVAGLTLKFIDQQLEEIRKSLNNSELALQKFKEEKGTVDLGEESKAYLERVTSVDEERIKAEIELRSLDYLYDYVTKNRNVESLAPSSIGNPDPLLVELITRIKELQSRRMSLMYGSSPNSPAIKVIDDQIEQAKAALIENINSIRSVTKANLAGLNDQLNQYEQSIKKVPNIERELLTIHRDFSVNENIYLYLLEKKAETSIAKATAVSDNKILDPPSVDDTPISPDKKIIFILAILISLFLPVIVIFLDGYFKNTISGKEDVEKLTSIPVIGIVGHMSNSDRLIVAAKPKSAVSEAFRSIRANLLFFGLDTKHKVILITSTVGGEGKSFSTLNLAAVLSLQNHKVIIVGMDLRKPQLIEDLGVQNKYGVSTLLIGKTTLEQSIQKTKLEGLDIIASGPVPPNPAELLAKKEIVNALEELKTKYDYIIIDTPPIGIVSDAMMLMNYSDINIFILRENYSRKDYLKSINGYYSQGKIRNMCILINDVSMQQRYGYGYNNGYYDAENNQSLRKKILSSGPFYSRKDSEKIEG
jgi:tyrosine-protein kinase Etk/Wzc